MKSRSTYVIVGFAALFVVIVLVLGGRNESAEEIARVEDGLARMSGEYSTKYVSKTGLFPGPDHVKGWLRDRGGTTLSFCVVSSESSGPANPPPPPDDCATLNRWNTCAGLDLYVGTSRKPPSPVGDLWSARSKMSAQLESVVYPFPCGIP